MVRRRSAGVANARGTHVKSLFQGDVFLSLDIGVFMARTCATSNIVVACGRAIQIECAIVSPRLKVKLGRHRARIESTHAEADEFDRAVAFQLARVPTSDLFVESICTLIKTASLRQRGPINDTLIRVCGGDIFSPIALRERTSFSERLPAFRLHEASASASPHAAVGFRTNIVERAPVLRPMLHDDGYAQLRCAVRGIVDVVEVKHRYNRLLLWEAGLCGFG